jgi:hypothetical protein
LRGGGRPGPPAHQTAGDDDSHVSPIEPSHLGGALPRAVADYCFEPKETAEK